MSAGVFGVARDIWDHPVLSCPREPFTKREAWMWLVSSAAWKPIKVGRTGRVIDIQRGEFSFSIRFLDQKWNWKSGRAERFLSVLEKHDMIRGTERDGIKVYSICNYNDYQVVGLPKRDSERDTIHDTTATVARHDRDKEETLKHLNTKPSSLRSDGSAPKRKTQIPENFPSQDLLETAVKFWTERGRTDLCATVADEAANFRDKAVGEGWVRADWPATWRTWTRNAIRFNRPQQRLALAGRESPLQQAHRIANELANTDTGDEIADHGENHRVGNALPQIGHDRRRA